MEREGTVLRWLLTESECNKKHRNYEVYERSSNLILVPLLLPDPTTCEAFEGSCLEQMQKVNETPLKKVQLPQKKGHRSCCSK